MTQATRSRKDPSHRLRVFVLNLSWLLLGVALTALVLLDPFDWHPWDRGGGGALQGAEVRGTEEATARFWTCSMHPEVIQSEPGQCPICAMDLVPMRGTDTPWLPPQGEPHAHDEEILFYRHPMDPSVTSPVPRQDEMGMDYVPVYAGEAGRRAGEGATVAVDPGLVQTMNIKTETVRRRDLRRPIRSVGYLEYDQEKMVTVTTKYGGFIEKVYVNYIGQPVERGQRLFEIYSPELVQTAQELLSAVQFARRLERAPEQTRRRAEALVTAARTRLAYWDISAGQIEELERTGEVFRTLTVTAPSAGVVMKRKPGLEGMGATPGMEIFHIADLSTLWLSVELFEDQVAWVREGMAAEVTFTYFPGETFRGIVRFVEPEFSEQTRTLRVTLHVPNPDRRLRKGMFATVVFDPVVVSGALAVPSLAVLRTGERNVVVVEVAPGRFAPRDVLLGQEAEGYVEVLQGVGEGEEVVTSSQFLLDSESSLQEAIQKLIAQKTSG